MDLDFAPLTSPLHHGEATASFLRALEPSDIEMLKATPVARQVVKRLRNTHHAAARALAAGMRPREVSLITGYSLAYVSTLQNDPAFSDLVSFYKANLDAAAAGLYEMFSAFSKDVFEELRERFEAEPDGMSNSFLLDMLKTFADRSGTGPRSTVVNVNVDLAGRLEAARRRAGLGEAKTNDGPEVSGFGAGMVALPSPAKVVIDA